MQFDIQRAFPYPVLRPFVDDYVDAEFQASVEIEPMANSQLKLKIQCALSVDEIVSLIKSKRAELVVVLACRDTYYRGVHSSNSLSYEATLPAGLLRGDVTIYPYVVATKPISKFTCKQINQEFGPGPFSFAPDTLLAVDEPKTIYIDRDVFRPITSVFDLVKNENVGASEWRLDLEDDRVQIGVSPGMKEKLDAFRNSPKNRAILLNSIYFAAVMQCVSALKNEQGGYDDRRWAQVLRQQCANVNVDPAAHDEYFVAQALMKQPFGRLAAYCLEESGE